MKLFTATAVALLRNNANGQIGTAGHITSVRNLPIPPHLKYDRVLPPDLGGDAELVSDVTAADLALNIVENGAVRSQEAEIFNDFDENEEFDDSIQLNSLEQAIFGDELNDETLETNENINTDHSNIEEVDSNLIETTFKIADDMLIPINVIKEPLDNIDSSSFTSSIGISDQTNDPSAYLTPANVENPEALRSNPYSIAENANDAKTTFDQNSFDFMRSIAARQDGEEWASSAPAASRIAEPLKLITMAPPVGSSYAVPQRGTFNLEAALEESRHNGYGSPVRLRFNGTPSSQVDPIYLCAERSGDQCCVDKSPECFTPGGCFCDSSCSAFNDCCPDFDDVCVDKSCLDHMQGDSVMQFLRNLRSGVVPDMNAYEVKLPTIAAGGQPKHVEPTGCCNGKPYNHGLRCCCHGQITDECPCRE